VLNVGLYLEIADLFRFRYDPAVLGVVSERPYRFRELVNRLETRVAGHVDDNSVGRSLKRLVREQRVLKTKVKFGRRNVPVYSITAEGHRQLQVYDAFADAYRVASERNGQPGPGSDTAA
jgi:DNA-binding PadR family transcriptional regulator